MNGQLVSIDNLSSVVKKELEEYCEFSAEEVKQIVGEVGENVKKEIMEKAPVDTGAYRKSWRVSKEKETATSLSVVVYSEKHYRLTHLLEKGHAKRGGGRVDARVHIAPAEASAEKQLLEKIERKLKT